MSANTWPDGLHAITLFVEDLAAAREFYARAFGGPAVFETDDSAVFKLGITLLNLLLVTSASELVEPARVGAAGAGARQVLSIRVADVDATCAQLVERGVRLLNGPVDRPWGVRTASFQDPAGHVWELCT